MADENTKEPNVKQPGEHKDGTLHYNIGNMAGKEAGVIEQSVEQREETPKPE